MNEDLIRKANRLQIQIDNLVKPETGRWLDWTPTVTQDGNVPVTVNIARYVVLVPNFVKLEAQVTMTGSGGSASIIVIGNLPIPVKNTGLRIPHGTFIIENTGTSFSNGNLNANISTEFRLFFSAGVSPGFTLAPGDRIGIQASYEAT